MSSCLGIYIENNLIKYAKVSKEHDIMKVDTFGIKFYENLADAIEQIINETFSFRVPISVNLQNEQYNYFEMFSLLSQKDMTKAVDTEFDLLCEEKGYNHNTLEGRYMLTINQENRDKSIAMHVSTSKSEISKTIQEFQKNNLKAIVPLPIAIASDIEIGVKDNVAILNLEERTTLTTVINGQVYKVNVLENSMDAIYGKINSKENSYAKVYDILKNTTIYTTEGLQEEENPYLRDIMPTLFNIISEAKDLINSNINNIEKLYITGTGAVINNIDRYFQEYLMNTKCEIMRPYFMKNAPAMQTNIKDYIEVNSAIALALQGVGDGIKEVNFKTTSALEKIKEISNIQINIKGKKGDKQSENKAIKNMFRYDLGEKLDRIEFLMLNGALACLLIIIVYAISSLIITNMIDEKHKEAVAVIEDTNAKLETIKQDNQKINNKITEYETRIKRLDEINTEMENKNRIRNSIPNLLSKIMTNVPKNVQITLIQNKSSDTIVIEAQAAEYDPLGYFLAAISTKGILVDAKSNSGSKQNGVVRITIEGRLP